MQYKILPLIQGPLHTDPEEFIESNMSYPIFPAPVLIPLRHSIKIKGNTLPEAWGDCYLSTYMVFEVGLPVEQRTCRSVVSHLGLDDLTDVSFDAQGDIRRRNYHLDQKRRKSTCFMESFMELCVYNSDSLTTHLSASSLWRDPKSTAIPIKEEQTSVEIETSLLDLFTDPQDATRKIPLIAIDYDLSRTLVIKNPREFLKEVETLSTSLTTFAPFPR